jgi:hypothetical protein
MSTSHFRDNDFVTWSRNGCHACTTVKLIRTALKSGRHKDGPLTDEQIEQWLSQAQGSLARRSRSRPVEDIFCCTTTRDAKSFAPGLEP